MSLSTRPPSSQEGTNQGPPSQHVPTGPIRFGHVPAMPWIPNPVERGCSGQGAGRIPEVWVGRDPDTTVGSGGPLVLTLIRPAQYTPLTTITLLSDDGTSQPRCQRPQGGGAASKGVSPSATGESLTAPLSVAPRIGQGKSFQGRAFLGDGDSQTLS